MKIYDFPQGSPEWFKIRCGIPTASNFDKLVTSEGKLSKQRQKYLYKVAGEYITGVPEETYQNAAMVRGVEMEAEARNLYQVINDVEVQQVGFCVGEPDIEYGCSPDGLVGDNGMIEIKCPSLAVHVGYLLDGKLPVDYVQQVQGELLVTGRDWNDFVSYYPGIKPLIVRVQRDGEFIRALRIELKSFCKQLRETIKKLGE